MKNQKGCHLQEINEKRHFSYNIYGKIDKRRIFFRWSDSKIVRRCHRTNMSQSEPTTAVTPSSNKTMQDKAARHKDMLRSCFPSSTLYIFSNVSRLTENIVLESSDTFMSVTSSLCVSKVTRGNASISFHFQ